MLKLLTKIFLSGGATLGTFAITGNLPNQKKENATLLLDIPKSRDLVNDNIATIQDIGIFERKHNCSFSFVDRWDAGDVYSVDKFLKKNTSDAYRTNAITKANEFKEQCKKHGIVVLFYNGHTFSLSSNHSES